ncbi:MAG: lytic transglycosylase domain-containing protein [Clostridia bacterium]|nr:lytic transglycosylase domain-containing protein [Clostridia bacterium]
MLIFSAFALCVRDYLFPLKYGQEVQKYANEYSVDTALLCAVINCESSFDARAVSKKGAVGLMQIMPSTAKWCAQKLGIEYSENDLFDPEYNIKIGAYYLSYLLQKFGSEKLALCAYNAGEGNVIKWLNENRKDIPFSETRGYVPRVLFNKRVYFGKFR